MEEHYAASVMQEWIRCYKPMPLSFRNANEEKGIYGCIVVCIQDKDGKFLEFIEKIARFTNAKIEIV